MLLINSLYSHIHIIFMSSKFSLFVTLYTKSYEMLCVCNAFNNGKIIFCKVISCWQAFRILLSDWYVQRYGVTEDIKGTHT